MEQFMNNNYYNAGYMGGAYYGQPVQPKAKMTNPLTPEERETLKVDNSFTLQVTPQEMAESVCTHKHPDKGEFSVIPNADGTVTCTICHQTFNPNAVDDKYVGDAVDAVINTLETCKFLAVDMNPEIIRGYFQMIPFLKKLPQFYKLAHQSYMRYNNANPQVQQPGGPNYFNAMNMLTNPAVPIGAPMYGQPAPAAYPYAQANPYGYATPTQQMQMQATPGGMSPFYTQQQPVASQPAPQQAQNPMQMNPPAYEAPKAEENTVQVKEQVQL